MGVEYAYQPAWHFPQSAWHFPGVRFCMHHGAARPCNDTHHQPPHHARLPLRYNNPAVPQAVQDDDLPKLQRACEVYRKLPGAILPPPAFITASGLPLTAVAAARNAQPRVVVYLATQGAELNEAALK